MGELAEEQAQLETLPTWVPLYLAAWGSLDPEGKRMRVKTAAGLAGVTDSAVRELRRTNEQFRLLEQIARKASQAFLSSYMEAGIRASAPQLLQAYLELVANRNPQVVLQGMKWALDKPEAVNVNLKGVVATEYSDTEWAQSMVTTVEALRARMPELDQEQEGALDSEESATS